MHSSSQLISRRDVLSAAAAWAALTVAGPARARGRLPAGGSFSLHVPWSLDVVDPHRGDDATAAIFGGALFDSLYAFDEGGAIVPVLAESLPVPDGDGVLVPMVSGVTSAEGRPIDARDVVGSIARARSRGASGWLAEVPVPTRKDTTAVRFATKAADKVALALASPLTAVVPLTFNPERPDGTGAFRAERRGDAWVLTRNPRAVRGPALLDSITVRFASGLAVPLRAFETGADDLGWLGSGLHEPRAGARPFDAGAVAWAVLRTGKEAGPWDQPGVPQRIADGIPPTRLSYLALGPPWRTEREEAWSGAPNDLLVRDDSPWLLELARAVAATLSRPGHELTPKALPSTELSQRLRQRSYALAIDVARPLAPGTLGALVGLASADDPRHAADLMRRPPRFGVTSARNLTRTLRLGVLGEIRLQGGRVPDLTLPLSAAGGWDLALATRAPPPPAKRAP